MSGDAKPDLQTGTAWHVGQRAVIDGERIVTVERVTPSVVADGRRFNPDGTEHRKKWRGVRLELLTPELDAKVALIARARIAAMDAREAAKAAEHFMTMWFNPWTASESDVDRAERLATAIRQAMAKPESAASQTTGDAR